MSLFRWFGKRAPAPESEPQHSSGLGSDATMPLHQPPGGAPPAKATSSSGNRGERLERREMLYQVVRECMTGAGVLSSSYKFKVLSLDATGRKYLIMMDVPQSVVADPARFAEIEGSIARSAKERFAILVTAVYWRVNELVSSGGRAASARTQLPRTGQVSQPAPAAAQASEAVLDDEVQAFKRAVASAASAAAANRSGEVVRSTRRSPEPVPDFSDTEPFEAASPLGPTQFGGLN
ncbi:MAG: hypothetical protein HXX19_11155 [Rhodoferax sp.]|nr:hypothetical protein [Rhodoferax sp.]